MALLSCLGCGAAPEPDGGGDLETRIALLVVSGNNQTGVVNAELANPVVVRVVRGGAPVRNQVVNFVVTTAAEVAISPDGGADAATTFVRNADPFNGKVFAGVATTDNNGNARDFWTLGTLTNVPQRLEARAVDAANGKQVFATFMATAMPGSPFNLSGVSSPVLPAGDAGTTVTPGSTLNGAGRVKVTDRFGNPVPGVAVTYAVSAGGGTVSPTNPISGADGTAQTSWTLGPTFNLQNELTASAAATTGSPLRFTQYVPCGPGRTACVFNNGVCNDVQSDTSNCGSCGRVCGGGTTCTAGACGCAVPGQTLCFDKAMPMATRCVSLQSDPNNCGFCGRVCPSFTVCSAGSCQCPGAGSPDGGVSDGGGDATGDGAGPRDGGAGSGRVACGNACVDTQTDPNNCGFCGNVCPAGSICSSGSCQCGLPGQFVCGGMPPTIPACVSVQTDPNNCGFCGNVCPPFTICSAGACQCAVPGRIACGGACVDQQTDVNNCGGCGVACPAASTCSNGGCVCTQVGQIACGNACIDPRSDQNNCGVCGNACPSGSTCTSERCICDQPDLLACSTGCVDPRTDRNNCGGCGSVCPANSTCTGGRCTCAVAGQQVCGFPSGLQCIDVTADPLNCGGCGQFCPSHSSCSGGQCVCDSPGQAVCYTTGFPLCIDVRSDPKNCGSCGNVCPSFLTCQAGVCQCPVAAAVDGGTSDASMDGATDGGMSTPLTNCGSSCVDTQTDPNNCGACSARCLPGANCSDGVCSCPTGTIKCGGACVDAGLGLHDCNGSCVDFRFDSSNCGACGVACPRNYFCSQGACQFACGTSNAIFCSNFGCVDPNFDPRNCGGCDVACKPNAFCDRGVCQCPGGTINCGTACADFTRDPDNCGACGNACPTGQRLCSAGVCAPCSDAGFAECNSRCVDLGLDKNNCGACGAVCGDNQACVRGVCVSGM